MKIKRCNKYQILCTSAKENEICDTESNCVDFLEKELKIKPINN